MKIPSVKGKYYIGLMIIIFLSIGCASTRPIALSKKITHELTFPKDFLWGAATSSHQVEGNNTNNDWWEWEQTRLLEARSGLACDQWNRFEEDFKLVQTLGHNAHRFSIEWSRIEPQEGQFDAAALNHYRAMIESLKSKGIEPIVTLHHFTLPLWLAHQGGWLSEKTPELLTAA